MPTRFSDLEIHIFEREAQTYPVVIQLNDQVFPRGYLSFPLLLPWTPDKTESADGQSLFALLFSDPVLRSAWDYALGQSPQRRIRLWIDEHAPELHTVPWELLQHEGVLLATHPETPFSRYLPSQFPIVDISSENLIRIVVAISNPYDLDTYQLAAIDAEQERKNLEEALSECSHIRIEFLSPPITLTRLENALSAGCHILHYIGHGVFNRRQRQAGLYLQNAAGNAEAVISTRICELIKGQTQPPRLIFLSACQSATRDTDDAFRGLGPQLVEIGIPAVVAMQHTISLTSARELSHVFYTRLLEHGIVDLALNQARGTLVVQNRSDAAVPVLFMRLQDGQIWDPVWAKLNPYRGLFAFAENDAAFFFGRDKLREELLTKVDNLRFVAVVGPSGSGKSSLVMAGLLPNLLGDWLKLKMRPTKDPFDALQQIGLDSTSSAKLAQSISNMIRQENWKKRLFLFIDQFEELFTLCPQSVWTRFLEMIQSLIDGPLRVTVLVTIRADFYGYLQNSPLGKCLGGVVVDVLPMESEDLRAVIEMPAQNVGLRFEAGLVETMINDVRESGYYLPLLQSALTRLWWRQKQGVLTYKAYQAVGRVSGAIGAWAADTFNKLDDEQKILTRRIFTRLVHYSEGEGGDTRRLCTLDDLLAYPGERTKVHNLVHILAGEGARLLLSSEREGIETVEIVHDALLKQWVDLSQWIAEQREFYLWRQRLDTQLNTWQTQQRTNDALLRGVLLAEAEKWLDKLPTELNEAECAYILKSREENDRIHRETQTTQRRRTRIFASMLTTLFIFVIPTIFVTANVWMFYRRQNSNWQYTGFVSNSVTSIAVSQQVVSSPRICVGTADIGVGCSYDLQNWNVYQVGLPTTKPAILNNRDSWLGALTGSKWSTIIRGVQVVAFDHLDSRRLYASMVDQPGLYRSTDSGASWQPILAVHSSSQPMDVQKLEVYGETLFILRHKSSLTDPQHRDSLQWSVDGGGTWESIGGLSTSTGIIYDFLLTHNAYGKPEQVYAAAETGLWRSAIDGDWAWGDLMLIETGAVAKHLVTDGETIYLATYNPSEKLGAIYRWTPESPDLQGKWLEYRREPMSMMLDPDSQSDCLLWLLLKDGKVVMVDHSGQMVARGRRPGWPWSTAKTLGAFPESGEAFAILMGHRDGLLQFTATGIAGVYEE